MIDLHNHILPGIDDGSPDLEHSLAMAMMAVNDGITALACTPHIYPGVYNNDTNSINAATEKLAVALRQEGIELKLHFAADAHLVPNMIERLRDGTIPTFNGGRYFLLEFPHHGRLPNYRQYVFNLLAAGYVPLITHPERLHWMDDSAYQEMLEMAKGGAWMQVTAGSVLGHFGKRAKYWAMRMLDDGVVHVLATDAHNATGRAPKLAQAVHEASLRVGKEEAMRQVLDRPRAVLDNAPPASVPPVPAFSAADAPSASRPALVRIGDKFRRWMGRLNG